MNYMKQYKLETRGGVTMVTLPSFEADGHVIAAFSTRRGGISEGSVASLNLGYSRPDSRENVQENYRRICEALGLDSKKVALTRQMHTDIVLPMEAKDAGLGREDYPTVTADAAVTNERGVVLAKLTADCVPVLLYDPVSKSIGAVHAGWRGTVQQITKKTVEQMQARYGAEPENILAAIGPSIGPCCFEVEAPVAEEFKNSLGDRYVTQKNETKYLIDLWQYNKKQLAEAGLLQEHIILTGLCTLCGGEDLFYSFRRDGESTGSLVALIALK